MVNAIKETTEWREEITIAGFIKKNETILLKKYEKWLDEICKSKNINAIPILEENTLLEELLKNLSQNNIEIFLILFYYYYKYL